MLILQLMLHSEVQRKGTSTVSACSLEDNPFTSHPDFKVQTYTHLSISTHLSIYLSIYLSI